MSKFREIAENAKRATMASEAQAERSIERLHRQTMAALHGPLDAWQRGANGALRDGKIPLSWARRKPSAMLLNHVHVAMDHQGASIKTIVVGGQHEGVVRGAVMAHQMMQETVPQGQSHVFRQATAARASAREALIKQLFDSFGSDASDAVYQAIKRGVIMGKGPDVIAREIRQSLDMSRQRAITIARTESLRAMSDSALENYRANSDVVRGWVWVASMGGNTCAACTFMDGTEHDLDEDLDDHVCGRCAKAPLTRSWNDILGDFGIDGSDIPETSIDLGDRGEDWFNSQDEAMQESILGPAKFNAWQQGDLSLEDLIGVQSDDWGTSIYEKSMKELGLDASDYLDD